MSDYSELKRLAELQPVKEWKRTAGRRSNIPGEKLMYGLDGPEGVSDCEDWGFTAKAAEFIAAADPAAVLALIAEVEFLTESRKEARDERNRFGDQLDAAELKIDQLKAEVEALRKDAERYRYLRDGDDEFVSIIAVAEDSITFLGESHADSAVDAAMSKECSQ